MPGGEQVGRFAGMPLHPPAEILHCMLDSLKFTSFSREILYAVTYPAKRRVPILCGLEEREVEPVQQ